MFGLNSSRKLLPGPSEPFADGDDQHSIRIRQVLLEETLVVGRRGQHRAGGGVDRVQLVGLTDRVELPVVGVARETDQRKRADWAKNPVTVHVLGLIW